VLPITNTKIETLEPKWARFVGYSLLFDNPGDSLCQTGGFERIHCEVDSSSELVLYRELSRATSKLGKGESNELGLCLLLSNSYHVTFFDCGNQANAEGAHPVVKSALTGFIEGLPESWTEEHELVLPAARCALALSASPGLFFRYSGLRNWGNQVIVAVLEPSDEATSTILEGMVEGRANLSNYYQTELGFGTGPKYTPHVSLGYFANEDGGEKASAELDAWDDALRERTEGLQIRFNSIGTYAFTDMVTFFRKSCMP